MENEDKSYLNCVHCGKCLPVCPTYNIGLNEFFSPRGRIRIISAFNDRVLPLKASKVKETVSACLLCERCVKICPNNVETGSLIINEKTRLNRFKGNKLSFDRIALTVLKNKRKVLLRSALELLNMPIIERLKKRYTPKPDEKPFIGIEDLYFKSKNGNDLKPVGYFSGCVFDSIYSGISVDTVSSLVENGVSVFVPQMQGCCGLPFISSGDIGSFKDLALNNANAFKNKDIDHIITSCASCSYSINNLYPLYFNKNDEGYGEIMNFSKKLLNIWSFFKILEKKGIDMIKMGRLKEETDAVFHIPCHLLNSPGFQPSSYNEMLIGEAGFIADKINGLKLKSLKHNYCCGNGGMFNIRHYGLSKKITGRKFEEIKEASPQTILTSCSGCIFSLSDQKGILKEKQVMPVDHLISIYARSLRNLKD
ncbi:(Fe-S)-binding protein [Candidatus Acidulodesulfobacterium sp. H_13]|uniref:(Fe-S)-binding protein n=1 Tax=Candidatus Acidulodesulfobacterium sp. H_13 TaxID=3395470 RepID=UPI003AF5980A